MKLKKDALGVLCTGALGLLGTILVFPVGAAIADSVEITAPIAVVSPFTYWPANPERGRFYRPTGVRVGNNFFLYVQGGAYVGVTTGPGSETCPSIGEKALAFKAPWTSAGLRSPFTYMKSVAPCKTDVPQVHYQTGSAFVSSTDNKVKLTVDQTENGSDPLSAHFKRVLLGSSSDGLNFTWSTFLQQSQVSGVTYSFAQAQLVQATANTNWWGSFLWAYCTLCNGSDGSGFWQTGRIRVIMDAANPRGFVVYLLASDQTWRAVNDDGTFNFVPAFADGGGRIVLNTPAGGSAQWEAWNHAGGTATGGCEDGTATTSSFTYRKVTQTGPSGPPQTVTSTTRAMPTLNYAGRLDPFRIQDMNGKRLVYSSSLDRMCFEGRLNGFRGMEILQTEVNN